MQPSKLFTICCCFFFSAMISICQHWSENIRDHNQGVWMQPIALYRWRVFYGLKKTQMAQVTSIIFGQYPDENIFIWGLRFIGGQWEKACFTIIYGKVNLPFKTVVPNILGTMDRPFWKSTPPQTWWGGGSTSWLFVWRLHGPGGIWWFICVVVPACHRETGGAAYHLRGVAPFHIGGWQPVTLAWGGGWCSLGLTSAMRSHHQLGSPLSPSPSSHREGRVQCCWEKGCGCPLVLGAWQCRLCQLATPARQPFPRSLAPSGPRTSTGLRPWGWGPLLYKVTSKNVLFSVLFCLIWDSLGQVLLLSLLIG